LGRYRRFRASFPMGPSGFLRTPGERIEPRRVIEPSLAREMCHARVGEASPKRAEANN